MAEEAYWLLNWFKQRGPLPDASIEEQLCLNYYDAGLVDSLGVIQLIASIEEHFGIEFNEEHFQDRRFSTINGLAELIAELLNQKEDKANP